MKKSIEKKLKRLTRLTLEKQEPRIVTITGSVGKTSTKEAVYSALKNQFNVRRSLKNYNNEIGVPMTVLGNASPGKSIAGWLEIFSKFVPLISLKNKKYPEVLVLEIGSDKPGYLKYLMKMLPKNLLKSAVLTAVTPAHLEFFGDMENLLKEKITPFFYLTENGFAILDKDSCDWEEISKRVRKKFITYSLYKEADVTADDLRVVDEGVAFTIKYQGNSAEFLLKDAVAPHQVSALLAGVCVGAAFGVGFSDIISGLKNYSILPGRMRKIKGINNSLIIDDTYNSSPAAAKSALGALSALPFGKRKIAVLGDMLEMGVQGEQLHREVGAKAAESNLDFLFTFGPKSEFVSDQAVKSGQHESTVAHFNGQLKLTEHLKELIKPNDVVLIKASQGMRLEKVVKALMASPRRASKLLVRQNKEWLKK